jgi:hypothetical protein
MNDLFGVLAVISSSAFPASHQASFPGRVPHVRGLSRTWVEYDLFPMLSPPVHTDLQEKKKEGLAPDFLWSLVALASLMRLSLLKAAHGAVGQCRISGNPSRCRRQPFFQPLAIQHHSTLCHPEEAKSLP